MVGYSVLRYLSVLTWRGSGTNHGRPVSERIERASFQMRDERVFWRFPSFFVVCLFLLSGSLLWPFSYFGLRHAAVGSMPKGAPGALGFFKMIVFAIPMALVVVFLALKLGNW